MATHANRDPDPGTPYEAALRLAAAGYRVIPIKEGGKHPPIPDWWHAATSDPEIIRGWYTGIHARSGVGIATGHGRLFALDIDVANGKPGAETLRDLEAAYGPLPETVQQMTGSGGFHHLFLAPEGIEIRNDAGRRLGAGLDIRGIGGQIVVAPSRHPSGEPYIWVFGRAPWDRPVADAPGWLIALLTREETPWPEAEAIGTANDPTAPTNSIAITAAGIPPAIPTSATPSPLSSPTSMRPGDRYNQTTSWETLLTADGWTRGADGPSGEQRWARPGKTPHEGISATVGYAGTDLLKVFTSSVPALEQDRTYDRWGYHVAMRYSGDFAVAASAHMEPGDRDLTNLLAPSLRAPPASLEPAPDDLARFWAARPELAHIYEHALALRTSPWATLGVVLARIVAAIPPTVVLPPLIGGVASLNLFVALVGRSGQGKGAGLATGRSAVTIAALVAVAEHTVGSGHGLAHAFGHTEKGTLVRDAIAALFTVEEVDHLLGHSNQTGSTVLSELRRLWVGERLGALYVDPTKRVQIEAHSYRASLVVGVQPARAGVLLDDYDGGLPQRFLWLPTVFAHPDHKPLSPAPWVWAPPRLGSIHHEITVCEEARGEIDRAALARARGDGAALDGHALLCREKVAAALGLLAGRAEITTDDWALSSVVMAVSDATRASVGAALASKAQEAVIARGRSDAVREDAGDSMRAQQAARAALRQVPDPPEWMGGAEIRRRLNSRLRPHVEEGLALLLASGTIRQQATANGQGSEYQATR